ncbi:hypothetical protein PV04_09425 [Phialophora macrospora]|uniref:Fungal N-terminal domain-containing protein n=1 Tax=Phialophora macrospora TaxID=1851006 RepID=A0A0D2CH53_9EURO|nr:hypothetical protein PV04_09425 [Phialophora macrospora]
MAAPVSFGDAYLMGKLAWRLGRAFTKGRKSAPAEFREVEHQLYSLSMALCALKDAPASSGVDGDPVPHRTQPRRMGSEQTITVMLQSCEEILKHLATIVEKYSCIVEQRDPQVSRFRRWSRHIRISWKKIAWTTQGGDLASLRSQLTIHTNSLNLVLGVAINSQTNRVEDQVEEIAVMMREIHDWFSTTLRATTTAAVHAPAESFQDTSLTQPAPLPLCVFELFAVSSGGESDHVICRHAALHPKWKINPSQAAPQPLFICQCRENAREAPDQAHLARVAAYALSGLSFPVRLTGKERSWMLYKVTDLSNNRLISLIIKNIPLGDIPEFEECFVQRISINRAAAMLGRGISTMLAYCPTLTTETRLLNLIGDPRTIRESIESITFSFGESSYERTSIETVQLLHYKAVSVDRLRGGSETLTFHNSPCEIYLDVAEIAVFYADKDSTSAGDVTRTSIEWNRKVELSINKNDATIKMKNVRCRSSNDGQEQSDARNFDVTFHLTTTEAATQFFRKLEEMRMELFVIDLRYPRKDERTVLTLQANQVQSEIVHISDADITIVQNTNTMRFRLIIVSRNGCSILSQELAEDFLSSVNASGTRPNFASPTFLVQMESTGKREVYRFDRGFAYLDFVSAQADRLFGLGLATIAGNLPFRPIES